MGKGTIGIPNGYFLKMAKHDYENHLRALPREFYQNSVDAGAEMIVVTVDYDQRSITVIDDGCGMTRDVLENKLLVLGGTHKAEGSVGAFGKAKELLFFSWLKYEIWTNDLHVEGSGAYYEILECSGAPSKGTIAKIWIQASENLDELVVAFKAIAGKMRAKTKIMVEGKAYGREYGRGMLVKQLDWVTIYQNKSHQKLHAQVMIDGIWMFDQYLGEGYGQLEFHLNRSSLDALTSNRDGLKYEYRVRMSKLVEDLMINKRSALDRRPPVTYERIKGEGAVQLFDELELEAVVSTGRPDMAVAAKMIAESDIDFDDVVVQRLENLRTETDAEEFVSQLKFLGYRPDFIIKYRAGASAKSFMETNKARVLARMWTETVKQVLLDNGRYVKFVAGFTFEGNDEAEHLQVRDEHYFLLNPNNLLNVFKRAKAPLSNRRLLVKDLTARAVHEAAHMNYSNHDENFVVELHKLEAHTWESEPAYKRIQKIQ